MDSCFVDVAVEFLSVAFHNILFYSSVYPENVFVSRKKYSVVVYRCIHPKVNEYIDMCLKTIYEALKMDQLQRVELAVTDHNYKPNLKFVFDIARMVNFDDTIDAYLVRCEQNLRAFCLQLATVSRKLILSSVDSSFAFYLYTNESTELSLARITELECFPLVEMEELEQFDCIRPLMRVSIQNYSIDAYIELPKATTSN